MAPRSIKDVLAVFSPDSSYLGLSSGDGRIKTWDVVGGQMRSDFTDIVASTSGAPTTKDASASGHLALDYTSIAWGSSLSVTPKKAKKRNAPSLLVMGTGSGDVLALDTVLGELKWRIDDVNTGGVSSMAFSKDGQRLCTAGADGMICELDVTDGQVIQKFKGFKTPLSSVALLPAGDKLLAANAEIKLFDLASKKKIRKFSGHPAPVKAMIVTRDGRYVLTAAAVDRFVAIWDTEAEKSSTGAAVVLPMDEPAVALDCSGFGRKDRPVEVLALTESGIVHVWTSNDVEGLSKAEAIKISVDQSRTASGKGSKSGRSLILAAKLVGASKDGLGAVLVARGTVARPQFERVALAGQSGSIVLTSSSDGDLLHGVQQPVRGSITKVLPDVTVLGPDNMVTGVLARAHLEPLEGRRKRKATDDIDAAEQNPVQPSAAPEVQPNGATDKRNGAVAQPNVAATTLDGKAAQSSVAASAEPIGAAAKSNGTEDQPEGPGGQSSVAAPSKVGAKQELSMEEQMIALGMLESNGKEVSNQKERDLIAVPRADSLQVLLSQAIQAEDSALLERCLGVTEEDRVITRTVSKLHVNDASKLLILLHYKLEARPRRGLKLVPWIRALLLQHTASIMSNPEMGAVLSSINQMAEARSSGFGTLLNLSGRLDFVVTQLPHDQEEKEEGPAVVYDDGVSDPESEDVMAEAESDDSDDDEAFDDEQIEEKTLTLQPNGSGRMEVDTDDDE